jgi:hypothetical protein
MLNESAPPLAAIALGLGMVVVTTVIHALFMVSGTGFADWRKARYGHVSNNLSKTILVSGLTVWMFLAVVIEVLLWASLYLYHPLIGELPNLETALYFSMVTFTSVGYGDVVIKGSWRVLASLQAANGMIVFGWTTALIFYYIQRIYARE